MKPITLRDCDQAARMLGFRRSAHLLDGLPCWAGAGRIVTRHMLQDMILRHHPLAKRPAVSRTAALRQVSGQIEVVREGHQFAVINERGGRVTLPDYWKAAALATRARARLALEIMGMSREDSDAAVHWAVEQGYTSAPEIVRVAFHRA